ncbi:hypothetical protein GCM10008101_00560 [Lysobacter xinjiangensis]|uniref:GtrA/DPMS transmembrane domain-containing protein n=2 Tax=Cognatilysobacter xinjiangensis TaxID=546892 RepID=A0ABQ3BR83_9GAMM|nr:hypothetical protein GCM10008101_00560 [Lysobacter xinjiangensis]
MAWPIAATLGFIAGTILLYAYSVHWVFTSRTMRANALTEFAYFASAGVLGLGLTQVLLYVGIEIIRMPPEAVRLAAAGVTFVFNYSLRTFLLFRKLPSV